jgi:hypothetical protein
MADIYVDPTSGDDTTGDGSTGTPYKTINKADQTATSGDTIVIKDGTHTLSANQLNTVDTSTTIRSENNDASTCIIDGTATLYYNSILVTGGVICTIQNITFKNMKVPNVYGVIEVSSATATILKCLFIDCGGHDNSGVIFNDNSTPSTITVDRCVFYGYSGTGGVGNGWFTKYRNSSSGTLDWNILNNVFVLTATSTPLSQAIGLATGWVGASGPVIVKNNIFYQDNASSFLIISARDGFDVTFRNNCTYATGTSGGFGVSTNVDTDLDNITGDPLFVDIATLDFRIGPLSPCINAGTLL